MELCQLFISVNIINTVSLMILLYMIFLMREVETQWLWYLLFVAMIVVATFGSKMYTGCEMSGIVWRVEWIPSEVGLNWQTYYLIGKFVWQGIYDFMVFVR